MEEEKFGKPAKSLVTLFLDVWLAVGAREGKGKGSGGIGGGPYEEERVRDKGKGN